MTAPTQYILLSGKSVRGPFTTCPALTTGETKTALTAVQYAALDTLRKAHPPGTSIIFDGTVFAVATIEELRVGLLSIFDGLAKWEQAIYAPQLTAVAGRIAAGDVSGVQGIITNSGAGMPDTIATARTAMLALIVQIYPGVLPSNNT